MSSPAQDIANLRIAILKDIQYDRNLVAAGRPPQYEARIVEYTNRLNALLAQIKTSAPATSSADAFAGDPPNGLTIAQWLAAPSNDTMELLHQAVFLERHPEAAKEAGADFPVDLLSDPDRQMQIAQLAIAIASMTGPDAPYVPADRPWAYYSAADLAEIHSIDPLIRSCMLATEHLTAGGWSPQEWSWFGGRDLAVTEAAAASAGTVG